MLVVMSSYATEEEIAQVVTAIEREGYVARVIKGGERTAIGILQNRGSVDPAPFLLLPGVKETIPVSKPYKLVSRELELTDTIVQVGDVRIGGENFVIIAGPCAVESETQALTIARTVKDQGACIFRGGAYKPRTSPYSFQGLGEEGLKILAKVREETGLSVVTEALDHEQCDLVEEYTDIIQIGARNMQNFSLLNRAGKARKPILLKRGMSATIQEWLMAAEYIMAKGNSNVILCERGVRTFADHSRNTLDLSAIPVVKQESHLPIIVDPSHACGRRDQVIPMSRASTAAGAHGLMVEVHNEPAKALSDGQQALFPAQFTEMINEILPILTEEQRTKLLQGRRS
ncbi:MAG: 3-deoxy-7-phosphoheptulonate synthase [Deltaproteobacteria bacterium]|jgi:3-deoxy-7-phosphoheptulonate synthase|nr:MAG: 3-deoxy-7-phosphoheptulonate synthase [Deltaproteobacteria bacterium]